MTGILLYLSWERNFPFNFTIPDNPPIIIPRAFLVLVRARPLYVIKKKSTSSWWTKITIDFVLVSLELILVATGDNDLIDLDSWART